MCVAMCVFHACVSNKQSWHLAEQPELWLLVRGSESPVHLHAFHSLVSLFFLQRPHMVFLISPPLLSHILALLFFFFFAPKNVLVSRNLRQQKGEMQLSSPRRKGLYQSPQAVLPKVICACFSAFEVLMFFDDRPGTDGPVNPAKMHFNVDYKTAQPL